MKPPHLLHRSLPTALATMSMMARSPQSMNAMVAVLLWPKLSLSNAITEGPEALPREKGPSAISSGSWGSGSVTFLFHRDLHPHTRQV
jgi:hypothetical protein